MGENEIVVVELKRMEDLASELEIAVEMLHFDEAEFSLEDVNEILDNLTSALTVFKNVANKKKLRSEFSSLGG